jgi:hypothetical protein
VCSPIFDAFLENPSFNSLFAVANSIDASKDTLTIAVPAVPVKYVDPKL